MEKKKDGIIITQAVAMLPVNLICSKCYNELNRCDGCDVLIKARNIIYCAKRCNTTRDFAHCRVEKTDHTHYCEKCWKHISKYL